MRAALGLAALALLLPGAVPSAAAQGPIPPLPDTPLYAYHDYATLTADLQALAAAHPDHAKLTSMGTSVLGLDVWDLEVGNFSDPAYRDLPALYVDAAHHGDDLLATEAAYAFAVALLGAPGADPELAAVADAHRVFITPLVNPDGRSLGQAENAHLVDLERNYPYHWAERGAGQAGTPAYPGPSAASEPEVLATLAFLQEVRPRAYVALRGGAAEILRPLGQAPDQPAPDEGVYRALLAEAAAAAGLPARWPAASGSGMDWAYGANGAFSVGVGVAAPFAAGPAGVPGALPGPLTDAEVRQALAPAEWILRHVLERTERWGGALEASIDDVAGSEATLVVRNVGLGPAFHLTAVGTGIALHGALPESLAPGAERRIAVAVDGPAQLRIAYQRLAIDTGDAARTAASTDADVPFHTGPLEPRPTPGAGTLAVAALALGALAALAVRRRRA